MRLVDRRRALKMLAGLVACPACALAGCKGTEEWSYQGYRGPDFWGDIGAANLTCKSGNQQSPIAIASSLKADLPSIDFNWRRRCEAIVNTGRTAEVHAGEGSSVTVGSDKYKLVGFHFHRPSEHMIGGRRFAMEAHFVHRAASGAMAIVAVMMRVGRPNSVFHAVVAATPKAAGASAPAEAAIDPNGLLPARRGYHSYAGSLTTPPCSETVAWMVLADPIEVATADIGAFAKLFPINARPLQKINRRFVLRS
jgi:carbonic anhydrase